MDLSIFSERLADLLEESDLYQKQIAQLLHMDNSRLTRLKNGDYAPTPEEIRDFCQLFQVSSDYLLGLTDSPATVAPSTKAEFDLLKGFREMSTASQTYVLESTRLLLDREKK